MTKTRFGCSSVKFYWKKGITSLRLPLSPFGISVVPGEVLAIVVTVVQSDDYVNFMAGFGADATYTGGQAFVNSNSISWVTVSQAFGYSAADYNFSTFVDAREVPEPSTVSLLVICLCGFLAFGRLRHKCSCQLRFGGSRET